jgi:hypothetical protein
MKSLSTKAGSRGPRIGAGLAGARRGMEATQNTTLGWPAGCEIDSMYVCCRWHRMSHCNNWTARNMMQQSSTLQEQAHLAAWWPEPPTARLLSSGRKDTWACRHGWSGHVAKQPPACAHAAAWSSGWPAGSHEQGVHTASWTAASTQFYPTMQGPQAFDINMLMTRASPPMAVHNP